MNMQVGQGRTGSSLAFPVRGQDCSLTAIDGQLREMAASIGADCSFVFRLAPISVRAPTHLTLALSGGEGAEALAGGFNARFSRAVLSHMEKSLTPLAHGVGESASILNCTAAMEAAGCLPTTAQDMRIIAFPVKLGGLGNGLTLFAGEQLACNSSSVLSLHRKSFQLMKGMLVLDIRETAPRQKLNDRELECLQLAGEGLKSEFIAERLALSVHTVNAYLGTATAKLDSVNRIQAIAKAIRLGYLA